MTNVPNRNAVNMLWTCLLQPEYHGELLGSCRKPCRWSQVQGEHRSSKGLHSRHKEAAGWFLENVVSGVLEPQTGSGNYYPPASMLFH